MEEDDGEAEEEELEMFDESIDRFEHSRWRARRLCRHFVAGRCEDGAARSRTANKSSTRLFVEQNVDVPVPQITVESRRRSRSSWWICRCHRSWKYCGSCADHTTGGACLRARSFEEIVEVTQFILLEFRNELVKFLLQEEVSSIVEQVVACQCHRSWSSSWCGY